MTHSGDDQTIGLDTVATVDIGRLRDYLGEHSERLEREGQHKLLAFAYHRTGPIQTAHRFINRVQREEMDERELRQAAAIRHESRLERRKRFGLYLPSNKRLGQRLIDGALNLLRHGSLHDPTARMSAVPADLVAASERMRIARARDVGELRSLLNEYEAAFRDRGRFKQLAFTYYHAGCLSKAAEYADEVSASELAPKERVFLENIMFEHRALVKLREGLAPVTLPAATPRRGAPSGPYRALYLAASSRPFVMSGYTSRSHALVTAMTACEDVALVPVTRPGFPQDRTDAKNLSRIDDGSLLFDRIDTEASFRGDLGTYLKRALPSLEAYAQEHAIDVVHGVSNYRNAVIGLALSRQLRVPFVYEIRGLWEETTDTKLAGWRETERFTFERRFEKWLARTADGVLCINAQVRRVLEIDDHPNVRLLPNCVPRASIVERGARDATATLRIGYIGSILEYEGLDDLVVAIARLQREGLDVTFDVYGQGADEGRLRDLAADIGARRVQFCGAVPPERVPDLYAGFDLCVFPRKPYRVCQLVTPLKPLEAMANDVNVIVSDVAPMAEIADDAGVGTFKAGDVDALADAIRRYHASSADARAAQREAARAKLRSDHVWERQCATIGAVYARAQAAAGGVA